MKIIAFPGVIENIQFGPSTITITPDFIGLVKDFASLEDYADEATPLVFVILTQHDLAIAFLTPPDTKGLS